ncbi:CPCC family cysteine-rich protein [Pseudophaeobacter arcticus]|jgi:hypothetical protein|uniref:CPCC family cysteine-rich protein n=1 Tax=Pseudophaeobacter arcticus TaxID=385492 RepID=UPI0003F60BD1|nr:CPCC family cysteine-rich protein [Pseudophaeobacter arcticus]
MKSPGKRRQARRGTARRLARPTPHLPCHCCNCLTICARGRYEICAVCFWEDDPGQTPEFDEGGANPIGLAQARKNYQMIGACEPKMLPHVRPPRPEERPQEV